MIAALHSGARQQDQARPLSPREALVRETLRDDHNAADADQNLDPVAASGGRTESKTRTVTLLDEAQSLSWKPGAKVVPVNDQNPKIERLDSTRSASSVAEEKLPGSAAPLIVDSSTSSKVSHLHGGAACSPQPCMNLCPGQQPSANSSPGRAHSTSHRSHVPVSACYSSRHLPHHG